MDVYEELSNPKHKAITCLEMHTTGEPTRIVIDGYPDLSGSLLEQRAEAKARHDHIRERLMLEPRGHFDMYGAILRPNTELTKTGAAHMGVLFTTNESYSSMCGHATIALGRFLIDTHDLKIFPRRKEIVHYVDEKGGEVATVKLHAPCGLVVINVPTTSNGSRSDPSRPVSFVSVASYATGTAVTVPIPESHRWPELGLRDHVVADFAYGGAFYCITPAEALGFSQGLDDVDLTATSKATSLLKSAISQNTDLRRLFKHPEHDDLSFLYSVILTDASIVPPDTADTHMHEIGLCYFGDAQVDRSPTGSGVTARMALAYAKGEIDESQSRTYHSFVSANSDWRGGFSAHIENVFDSQMKAVQVKVEGRAFYTGLHKFIIEDEDFLGQGGFSFDKLKVSRRI